MSKSPSRLAVESLLEAWARWRLQDGHYPAKSAIARLREPYHDQPFRSSLPVGVDAPRDVLQVTAMLATIASIDADKQRSIEIVQTHYLSPGKSADKAKSLGLNRATYHRQLSLGLSMLESVWSWSTTA